MVEGRRCFRRSCRQQPVVRADQIDGVTRSLVWGRGGKTIFVQSRDSSTIVSFWRASVAGGSPQRILRLDDPSHRTRRPEFDTDGRLLFFTISADEADVMVAHLRK
jgi:hypothetical protein